MRHAARSPDVKQIAQKIRSKLGGALTDSSDIKEGAAPPMSSSTDLSDDHLRALGEVAFWAARIERSMAEIVAALIDQETDVGDTVVTGMAFSQLSDLGSRLVARISTETNLRARFREASRSCGDAMSERNALMHAYWARDESNGTTVTLLARKRKQTVPRRLVTAEQIRETAIDLENSAGQLFIVYLMAIGMLDYVQTPSE